MWCRWERFAAVALVAVFFSLPGTCGSYDLSECTEFQNLSESVGRDAVIWPHIEASEYYSIWSPTGLMFEFKDGNVEKLCPRCVFKNLSAILPNIQWNESGIYIVKIIFNRTVCRNITVTELTPPFVEPRGISVGNGTVFVLKDKNSSNVFICVAVAVAVVIVLIIIAVVCWKWKNIRARCFQPALEASSRPSVQYIQC